MSDILSMNENAIPISRFDSGSAEEIFEDVNQSGIKVVVKDNTAECILLSPAEYVQIIDEIEDARLLAAAFERMKRYDPKTTLSYEVIKKELGITQEDLDHYGDVEFE